MFTLLTQEEATESYGDLREAKGCEKGYKEGHKEGLKALVKSLKRVYPDFDDVYREVKMNEIYADVTKAEVRQYY